MLPQLQSQGGQTSPGGQAGQAQVQVPPPPLGGAPASLAGGVAQAHCTDGQLPSAGQASGWRQAQPLPFAAREKQNPALQAEPSGQSAGIVDVVLPLSRARLDQAQRLSAWQAAWLESVAQGSAVWQTPAGQLAPAGQASTGIQAQPFCASPAQASALVCAPHASSTATAGIADVSWVPGVVEESDD